MTPALRARLSAFATVLLVGCSSSVGEQHAALDVNGDGLCDYPRTEAPPTLADLPAPLTVAAPYNLALKVAMADGYTAPRLGRVALVAFVPSAGSLDQSLQELFTTALPSALPAQVTLRLAVPPADVRERVRAFAANPGANGPSGLPARMSAYVVIYDDANANGHLDLGKIYGPKLADTVGGGSSLGSGADAWQSYTTSKDRWMQRYGGVDFLGFSSPSDQENEVLSATSVTIVWNDSNARYEIEDHHTDCAEQDRDGESCKECISRPVALNPEGASTVIAWSLARAQP